MQTLLFECARNFFLMIHSYYLGRVGTILKHLREKNSTLRRISKMVKDMSELDAVSKWRCMLAPDQMTGDKEIKSSNRLYYFAWKFNQNAAVCRTSWTANWVWLTADTDWTRQNLNYLEVFAKAWIFPKKTSIRRSECVAQQIGGIAEKMTVEITGRSTRGNKLRNFWKIRIGDKRRVYRKNPWEKNTG